MDKVTIIGGGIGGLSLATGLKRRGIDFEVYEATDEYRSVGAGIIWQVNTMQALGRLGLAEPVQKHGARHDKYVIMDENDEVVMEQDWANDFKDEFGYCMYGINRSMFQELLVEEVGPENITMGKECVGIEGHDDNTTVDFADGSSVDAEFVVGADGITSAVRRSLFPDATVEYLDCVTHRGLSEWTPPEGLRYVLWNVFGGDGHIGFVPLESETQQGYWFYTMAGEPDASYDPVAVKEELLERAESKPPRVAELIEATPTDSIISVDSPYVPPMDTWTRGNVTLLGDAAHGMTPHAAQGGGMAIEDALALSKFLDEKDSLEKALSEYEAVRIERANGFVERSKQNGLGAITPGTEHVEEMRHAPPEAIEAQTREDLMLGF